MIRRTGGIDKNVFLLSLVLVRVLCYCLSIDCVVFVFLTKLSLSMDPLSTGRGIGMPMNGCSGMLSNKEIQCETTTVAIYLPRSMLIGVP